MSQDLPQIVKLNTKGEVCPYPLIIAIKKAEEIRNDLKEKRKMLEVVTDCFPAKENIPTEFRKRGYNVKVEKIGPAKWKITIS